LFSFISFISSDDGGFLSECLLSIVFVFDDDSHDGDVAHMTQPDEFESYLLQALTKLDATLPTGSSVIFIGLVDGRILWNTLHSRTHPLGVSYEDVYGYLSCLHISPCQGWMTPNETIRNATSAQAALLSSVYKKVMAEHTFNSFNMAYYDYDVAAVQKILVERGGQPWELIEPIDGFHPSQIANSLFAEYFWNEIQRDHPDMLGQVNPNNAAIEAMFGKDPSW
jgi:acyloxyacyl hydrolase